MKHVSSVFIRLQRRPHTKRLGAGSTSPSDGDGLGGGGDGLGGGGGGDGGEGVGDGGEGGLGGGSKAKGLGGGGDGDGGDGLGGSGDGDGLSGSGDGDGGAKGRDPGGVAIRAASAPNFIMHHTRSASRSTNAAARPVRANSTGIVAGCEASGGWKIVMSIVLKSANRITAPTTEIMITTSCSRSTVRCCRSVRVTCAVAASSGLVANSSSVSSSSQPRPHSFTSVDLRSSSGSGVEEARSRYSAKCDSSWLASVWSTSGTTGFTSQRYGQAALPVRRAVARTSGLCSTRAQQPRQKRWSHESTTGRSNSSIQMGQV